MAPPKRKNPEPGQVTGLCVDLGRPQAHAQPKAEKDLWCCGKMMKNDGTTNSPCDPPSERGLRRKNNFKQDMGDCGKTTYEGREAFGVAMVFHPSHRHSLYALAYGFPARRRAGKPFFPLSNSCRKMLGLNTYGRPRASAPKTTAPPNLLVTDSARIRPAKTT